VASFAQLIIHESQFPAQVRRDLLASLRTRQINHKFHYDTAKQAQKWLAVHETYSPARLDPDCTRIYDDAFAGAIHQVVGKRVNLIGLGAGGGQKDARLLEMLSATNKDIVYRPVEGGTAMALIAREESLRIIAPGRCFPLVCDLANTRLSEILEIPGREEATRVFTFFGMLPNFEPGVILTELAGGLRAGDVLLVSANLAPGPDYDGGIRKIMPFYDNPETRDWLMTFLLDLGIEERDGSLEFSVQNDPAGSGLKRIEANFKFARRRKFQVDSEQFQFEPRDSIRLFFSYRHTPELLQKILQSRGLRIAQQWITLSEEEGVFRIARG
jgi:L-histidine N-alpha-methyltransferase